MQPSETSIRCINRLHQDSVNLFVDPAGGHHQVSDGVMKVGDHCVILMLLMEQKIDAYCASSGP